MYSRYFWMTSSRVPSGPMMYGLPQMLGRPTYTSYTLFLQLTTLVVMGTQVKEGEVTAPRTRTPTTPEENAPQDQDNQDQG